MKKKNLLLKIAIISNAIIVTLLIFRTLGFIKWGNINVYISFEVLLLIWLIMQVVFWALNRRTEKHKENLPYDFDVYNELDIYKNIGSKTEIKTYIMWKNHITDYIHAKITDEDIKTNFSRYINRKCRCCKDEYTIFTVIVIPMIVGAFSSMIAVYIKENYSENIMMIQIISTIILYTIIMTKELLDIRDRISFYEDIIEIIVSYNLSAEVMKRRNSSEV